MIYIIFQNLNILIIFLNYPLVSHANLKHQAKLTRCPGFKANELDFPTLLVPKASYLKQNRFKQHINIRVPTGNSNEQSKAASSFPQYWQHLNHKLSQQLYTDDCTVLSASAHLLNKNLYGCILYNKCLKNEIWEASDVSSYSQFCVSVPVVSAERWSGHCQGSI